MSLMSVPQNNGSELYTSSTHLVRTKDIQDYLHKAGFRLGKIIGEGSYSKVRICLRGNPDQTEWTPTACKIIDKRKASDDFVDKFLPRELRIVGRLSHPNIVSVFNVFEFHHNVYIFMDFCDNGDLLEFVKKKGFLSEDLSKHYFNQILLAVRYLHGLDLAHRDLKCENVLLTKQDKIKLSDFGFARECRDSSNGKRILSSTYCGSAAYAAPEILQGTKYNPKMYDSWSVGCVLFIMMTGHMPFDETDIPKMLHHQIHGTVTYPLHVDNLITKSAKMLVRHLLESDVTKRATIEQALTNSWFANYNPPPPPSYPELPRHINVTMDEYMKTILPIRYDEGDYSVQSKVAHRDKKELPNDAEEVGRQASKPERSRQITSSKVESRTSRRPEERNITSAGGSQAQSSRQSNSHRNGETDPTSAGSHGTPQNQFQPLTVQPRQPQRFRGLMKR